MTSHAKLRTRGFLIWSMAPIMWLLTVTGMARAVRSRSKPRSASAMFAGAAPAPPASCSACASLTPSCTAERSDQRLRVKPRAICTAVAIQHCWCLLSKQGPALHAAYAGHTPA